MKCQRCLNEDKNLFATGSKGTYCRACISFKRQLLLEEVEKRKEDKEINEAILDLKFQLTKLQKEVGEQLCNRIKENNVFLYAVCGAGKTEIMLHTIQCYLNENKRVALAIPRRQVVLELTKRLSNYFINNKVVALCEGYTQDTEGDLIICTTHQLYRFYQTFDLLILDEPDAFPYKGNKVLQGIAKTSCKGRTIYSSATIDEYLKSEIVSGNVVKLSLFQRPHGYPMIEPYCLIMPRWLCLMRLIVFLKKKDKMKRQVMIFCATIKQTKLLNKILGYYFSVASCTSKSENKDEIINQFRTKAIRFLVCTTILERGVTFPSIDVVVYNSNHLVFDEASLIQIAGRVGRSKEDPFGECLFLASAQSESVQKCIKNIKEANSTLSSLSSS